MSDLSITKSFIDLLESIIFCENNQSDLLDFLDPMELKDIYHVLFTIKESIVAEEMASHYTLEIADKLDFNSNFFLKFNELLVWADDSRVDIGDDSFLVLVDQAMVVLNQKLNNHIFA